MKDLSSFFSRIKALYDKEVTNTSAIADVFKAKAGIILSPKQMNVKDGILTVQVNYLAKSQIFIKKEKLLQALSEAVPHSHIKDIR